jgi:serine protease Do
MFKRDKLSFAAKGALALAILSVLVLGIWQLSLLPNGGAKVVAQEAVGTVNAGPIAFEDAVEKVAAAILPAVVHINVEKSVDQPTMNPFQDDPFFRYFFGPGQRTPQSPQRQRLTGLGTGMIIDAEGHILTNNHVVGGADKVTVKLSAGVELPAKVVGTDPKTDLAVIQVKPTRDMKYVSFGDSDKLRIGQWVVAIGSPRGLDQTVTVGVVSAKNRRGVGLLGPSGYEDYIQTDAAINPGNSGGPLVNLRGEVVGVNSAIFSTSGGFQGIGFAVPSNMAKEVATALIKQGKVTRGWLGVAIQQVTQDMVRSLRLKDASGIIVSDVTEGSPAAKAGIEREDVIVRYNGQRVTDIAEFRQRVAATEVGKEVRVVVVRRGQEREISVKIERQPDEGTLALAEGEGIDIGVRVENITSDVARRLGMRSTEGVLITDVAEDSPAAEAGLEPGDVILSINNEPVKNLSDYSKIISQVKKGDSAMMLVRNVRDGSTLYVAVGTG